MTEKELLLRLQNASIPYHKYILAREAISSQNNGAETTKKAKSKTNIYERILAHILTLSLTDRQKELLASEKIKQIIDTQLDWEGASPTHYILTIEDEKYPSLLRELYSPPLVLFCKGRLELLANKKISIVGSRTPTHSGIDIAKNFSETIAKAGYTIVSGMAKGIDAQAHLGALLAGASTIAILGSGIEVVYPKENQKLYQELCTSGLVISEFGIDSKPERHHFPLRNRIISGLSMGLLVVEASRNSGSLITAYNALEQNREVFAIPGSIFNSEAEGCNLLIQRGAKLVLNVADILTEFGEIFNTKEENESTHPTPSPKAELVDVYQNSVLMAVGFEATPLDIIMERLKSNDAGSILEALLTLELDNFIKKTGSSYIRIK